MSLVGLQPNDVIFVYIVFHAGLPNTISVCVCVPVVITAATVAVHRSK